MEGAPGSIDSVKRFSLLGDYFADYYVCPIQNVYVHI